MVRGTVSGNRAHEGGGIHNYGSLTAADGHLLYVRGAPFYYGRSADVDAALINASNGFAVLFEAKVLSDTSVDITYDATTDTLDMFDVDGTNGSSGITITDLNGTDLTVSNFTIDSDVGRGTRLALMLPVLRQPERSRTE